MAALWNHVLANCAIILFTILAWTHLPQARGQNRAFDGVLTGLFFGMGALAVMARPIEVDLGIYVDLRAIPLSVAGLAGGWPGALVAALIAAAFRLWVGGAGAFAGVIIIFIAATIGATASLWLGRRMATYWQIAAFSAVIATCDRTSIAIMPTGLIADALHQMGAIWTGTVFLTVFLSSLAVVSELRRRATNRALNMYEAVIRSLPESLNVKDTEGRFILANDATAKLMRAGAPDALIGKTDHDFYPSAIADAFRADELTVMSGDRSVVIEQELSWGVDNPIILNTLKVPLHDDEGDLIGLITLNRDRTERRRLVKALAESERRANAALNNMADGLIMFDADLNVIFCNEQYRAMFPLTSDVRVPGVAARTILEVSFARGELVGIPDDQVQSFIEGALSRLAKKGTVQFPLFDGRWIESRTTPSEDGGCLVVCSDITRSKRDEQELRHLNEKLEELAMTDSLTELLNRRAFDAALSADFARCLSKGSALSLLLIDIDHFKSFNDTYGHPQGDRCLRDVAKVVRSVASRPGARAARYGGEEMAIILPNTSEDAALATAHDLRHRIRELAIAHVGSEKAIVTVSIGVANLDSTCVGMTATQLVIRADEALYRSKAAGRDTVRGWQYQPSSTDKPAAGQLF